MAWDPGQEAWAQSPSIRTATMEASSTRKRDRGSGRAKQSQRGNRKQRQRFRKAERERGSKSNRKARTKTERETGTHREKEKRKEPGMNVREAGQEKQKTEIRRRKKRLVGGRYREKENSRMLLVKLEAERCSRKKTKEEKEGKRLRKMIRRNREAD